MISVTQEALSIYVYRYFFFFFLFLFSYVITTKFQNLQWVDSPFGKAWPDLASFLVVLFIDLYSQCSIWWPSRLQLWHCEVFIKNIIVCSVNCLTVLRMVSWGMYDPDSASFLMGLSIGRSSCCCNWWPTRLQLQHYEDDRMNVRSDSRLFCLCFSAWNLQDGRRQQFCYSSYRRELIQVQVARFVRLWDNNCIIYQIKFIFIKANYCVCRKKSHHKSRLCETKPILWSRFCTRNLPLSLLTSLSLPSETFLFSGPTALSRVIKIDKI